MNRPLGKETAQYGDGFIVSCICGWQHDTKLIGHNATRAYSAHLQHAIDVAHRVCRQCGSIKPPSDMTQSSRHLCKKCSYERARAYYLAHPKKCMEQKRDHHLRKTFGISLKDFDRLLAEQGGLCAVCRQPISDKRGFSPHVDHDHKTRTVRGILCFNCNVGLGSFRDNIRAMESAIEYLKKWNGES